MPEQQFGRPGFIELFCFEFKLPPEPRSNIPSKVGRSLWAVVQFGLFAVYFSTAIIRFWLWVYAAVFALLGLGLRFVTLPLRQVCGASPPGVKAGKSAKPGKPGISGTPGTPGTPGNAGESAQDSSIGEATTAPRVGLEIPVAAGRGVTSAVKKSSPLHGLLADAREALRCFWHYDIPRKAFAIVATMAFVGLPFMFVVPRSHDVQILDNNSLNYQDSKLGQVEAAYVVHAVVLSDPGSTREYINENQWWLGKLNSQGLKAKLQPGRYYRLWIVGIRWWYAPPLYPNIIGATEIDALGNEIPQTSLIQR